MDYSGNLNGLWAWYRIDKWQFPLFVDCLSNWQSGSLWLNIWWRIVTNPRWFEEVKGIFESSHRGAFGWRIKYLGDKIVVHFPPFLLFMKHNTSKKRNSLLVQTSYNVIWFYTNSSDIYVGRHCSPMGKLPDCKEKVVRLNQSTLSFSNILNYHFNWKLRNLFVSSGNCKGDKRLDFLLHVCMVQW